MGRAVGQVLVGVMVSVLAMPAANAGMPRGATISADEQDADPETGVTIARGNAEIAVEKSRILGRADTIEINPALKHIQFKGRAVITVGRERYASDAVICSLDFNRCANADVAEGNAVVPATPPATPSAGAARTQPLPPPAGLGAAGAVTNPR